MKDIQFYGIRREADITLSYDMYEYIELNTHHNIMEIISGECSHMQMNVKFFIEDETSSETRMSPIEDKDMDIAMGLLDVAYAADRLNLDTICMYQGSEQ